MQNVVLVGIKCVLLTEAKQTSWQLFNLFVQAVNELKITDPTVTGVIGQSDKAGRR